MNNKSSFNISKKTYIIGIAVLLFLMIVSYLSTFILPAGEYTRIIDVNGNSVIDTTVPYTLKEGGISFIKWILSPLLVLTAEGSTTIIVIIAFLMVIGASFTALETSGMMRYMLDIIINRFGNHRYKLLAIIAFFFMALGSLIGSFEEIVPLVPIVSAISIGLGFDAWTGLAVSLIAVGSGFASGIANSFTVGVAQTLAGLPLLSGMWYRALSAVFIYLLLMTCVYLHVKTIEKPVKKINTEFKHDLKMDKAIMSFGIIIAVTIVLILASSFIEVLQGISLIFVVIAFMLAGIICPKLAGMNFKDMSKEYVKGVINFLPAVVMILMASSIKYILVEAKIMDTILYNSSLWCENLSSWQVLLIMYFIALIVNFFVSSGSAEAILLMPLLIPIAQMHNIPLQLCILAFAYGDGFSNVFYPTNPVLLISIGLVDMSYAEYVKHTWVFQLINLLLTSALLVTGLAIGYR